MPKEEETVSVGEESVEALLGLVRSEHSPWALLKDSSAEDRFLRELAIQNPLMIKDTFFYSYFRSLRVVDKGVSTGCEHWKGRAASGGSGCGEPCLRTLPRQQESPEKLRPASSLADSLHTLQWALLVKTFQGTTLFLFTLKCEERAWRRLANIKPVCF